MSTGKQQTFERFNKPLSYVERSNDRYAGTIHIHMHMDNVMYVRCENRFKYEKIISGDTLVVDC